MQMTYVLLIVGTTCLAFVLMLLVVTAAFLAWRKANRRLAEAERLDRTGGQLPGHPAQLSDAIMHLEGLLQTYETRRDATYDRFAADLSVVRSEVEWLGGAWMIDEAVRMCRQGIPSDQIGEQLGISPESLRVLSLIRAH